MEVAEAPREIPRRHKLKKRLPLIALFVVLLVSIPLLLSFTNNTSPPAVDRGPAAVTAPIAPRPSGTPGTASPQPYRELTIPYLRGRSYDSRLGPRTVAYNGSNFTAYFTSYNSDRLKINGLLTIPRGAEPEKGWPAIVFVHGYNPPPQYSTRENYEAYVDYLAQNGYVVFKTDLRGHGNSQGQPGGSYYSSDYVIDTLNARAALLASDFVNPRAIGLWGHSMAGNITLRSVAVQPEIPAVAIWAGAVYSYADMQKYGIRDPNFQRPSSQSPSDRQRRRRELFAKVGAPSGNSPFWRQMAPIYFLDDMKGAVQIQHAVDDDVVSIRYTRDLQSALNRTDVPHEVHEYQTGGHNLNGPTFYQAMQRTVAFYDKYLKE